MDLRREHRIVVVVEAKFYRVGMIAPRGGRAEEVGNLDPPVEALFMEIVERARARLGIRP
jgi:hypothetical protein